MQDFSTINVFGLRMHILQIPHVVAAVDKWITSRDHGNYIAVCNAYDAAYSRQDVGVQIAANAGSLTVPDGISMVLLARLYGYPLKKRVYGPDLMLEIIQYGLERGWKHFFYGTTEKTLSMLMIELTKRYPGLQVAGTFAPPFRPLTPQEDAAVVKRINDSGADIVWVGLGTPKQQMWMYEHRDRMKVPVMLGVGAAFDFFAGTKRQAPRWIRDNGFEWLFRLLTEPRRLWKRYFVYGSLFVWYVCGQLLRDFVLKRFVRDWRNRDYRSL